MKDIILGTGVFIYPFGLCSILMVFITIERLIALRRNRIIPSEILESLENGQFAQASNPDSVMGRIINFFQENKPSSGSLKAYARYEVSRLERGFFILEIITGAAPLIGLLGTVTGLVSVFANFSIGTSPDSEVFVQGIALALTTTLIGLTIAIPSLVANSYLNRKVEALAAKIELGMESLISSHESSN